MNPEFPSPGDPRNDSPADLDRVERRLRQFRPRPAELNLAEVSRQAAFGPSSLVVGRSTPSSQHRARAQWMRTVAIAWSFGAIAGAAVAVFLVDRHTLFDGRGKVTSSDPRAETQLTIDPMESSRQDDSAVAFSRRSDSELPRPMPPSPLVALDPAISLAIMDDDPRFRLRAGDWVRPTAHSSLDVRSEFSSDNLTVPNGPDVEINRLNALDDAARDVPVTVRRLMRELLTHDTGSVL